MALTPGTRFDVLYDKLWWAPTGTVLPGLDDAYGADYPAGWSLIDDTENGVAVASRVTTVDYRSEERGTIGKLLGDDIGVSIGFTDMTPTWDLLMQLSQFTENTVAAAGAFPAASIWHQSAAATGYEIMIGFDGKSREGGLFEEDTLVRGIGYACVQSAATTMNFRHRGADSPIRVAAQMECTPYPVTSSQVTGTGIALGDLDPDGKFDFFVIEGGVPASAPASASASRGSGARGSRSKSKSSTGGSGSSS